MRAASLPPRRAKEPLAESVEQRTVALGVINELLFQEVAERKRWAEVLRESEAQHRALLNAVPDVLLHVRRDGQLLACQVPSESPLRLVPHEAIGQPLGAVLPPSLAEPLHRHLDAALATGQLQVFEERLPAEDGGRDVEVRVAVCGAEETLCLVRDVSERKRAEEMKNEFVSVVSHELRTPLTSINGALALLAAGVAGEIPEQAHAMIDVAYRNTERLVRLINDLLDIQKIESGTMPLALAAVNLQELVAQGIEANAAYGARHGVRFVREDDGADAWVFAAADRLAQVLTNLLSNAAKFAPEGDDVIVSVMQDQERVRVSVTDHGPGVPKAQQRRIFEKFAQADASNTRPQQGTGLGLSICKSIIERHGGRIGVESVPEVVTTFFFELPAYQPESSPCPRRPSSAS